MGAAALHVKLVRVGADMDFQAIGLLTLAAGADFIFLLHL